MDHPGARPYLAVLKSLPAEKRSLYAMRVVITVKEPFTSDFVNYLRDSTWLSVPPPI